MPFPPAPRSAEPRPEAARVSPRLSREAERRAYRTSALLAAHVPLSLLMDIADPSGPHSRHLLDTEPGSSDWLTGVARHS